MSDYTEVEIAVIDVDGKTSDVMVYIWIRLGIRFQIAILMATRGEIPPQYRWTKEDLSYEASFDAETKR